MRGAASASTSGAAAAVPARRLRPAGASAAAANARRAPRLSALAAPDAPAGGRDAGLSPTNGKLTALARDMPTPLHDDPPPGVVISTDVMMAPKGASLFDHCSAYAEQHRIRGGEVGPDRTATIATVANLLQEVASNHAVAIWGRSDAGFAADPLMAAAGLIFALTRLQIQMDAYPRWGDMVSVETWFQEEGRVAASRHWVLRDAATGAELGRATSTWVMVDTVSRRLVKMPEPMRLKLESLSPSPARLAIPAAQARLRIPDLLLAADEAGAPPVLEGPKQVARRADMDMNGHINNVTYLAWALETVPEAVYADGHLRQVELDYKSECLAGHTVESLALPFEGEVVGLEGSATDGATRFLHTLRRCDDEGCYELVRARTTWDLPKAA